MQLFLWEKNQKRFTHWFFIQPQSNPVLSLHAIVTLSKYQKISERQFSYNLKKPLLAGKLQSKIFSNKSLSQF